MNKNGQDLINKQLELVHEPILIDNVIGGDNTEVYVEFKGRSSRFFINEELGNNINKWLDNLPVITVQELENLMKKRDVTLVQLSELLEDEELMDIKNIDEWVKKYNNDDCFLPIEVLDRTLEVNL